MRKVVSALILTVLLVHLAGAYLFVVVRLGEIRMEQRTRLASLPADQLEVIQIPVAQFRAAWMKEREMEWNGKMFDLARVIRKGQVMIVYALHDEDEDNVLAFLSAVVTMARQDTQPAPSSVVQFISLEFITPSILVPTPAATADSGVKQAITFALPLVVLDPAFPPPRS